MFKQNVKDDPIPDFSRYIDTVISRVNNCEKHPWDGEGIQPCYILPVDSPMMTSRSQNWGVCNWRAKKAGFIGDISAIAMPKPGVNTLWVRK